MAFDDVYKHHVSITSTASDGMGIPGDYRQELGTTGGVYRLVKAGESASGGVPLSWSNTPDYSVQRPAAVGVPIVGVAPVNCASGGYFWMRVAGFQGLVNLGAVTIQTGEPIVVASTAGHVSKQIVTVTQNVTAASSDAEQTIVASVSATAYPAIGVAVESASASGAFLAQLDCMW